ncbi:MAG TPA: NUDIX domain-containing protein [Patescibacteria group bacterium]
MTTTQSQDEMLVRLNPEGEIIGSVSRKEAHNDESIIHAAVLVMIFTHPEMDETIEGKVGIEQLAGWFTQRSWDKDKYPGAYSVTAAGHVAYREGANLQELLDETAHRETAEEVGLHGLDLELIGTEIVHAPGEETQLIAVYRAITDALPYIADNEVAEIQLENVNKMRELIDDREFTPFALVAMRMLGVLS